MLQRVLTSLGAVGVHRVVSVRDMGGVVDSLATAVAVHDPGRDPPWPAVECLELPLTGDAADSVVGAAALTRLGVSLVIALGGDGTARLVASACGDVPLAALSTGTNNAFARIEEATVAGLAAGLVATGRLAIADGCRRSKALIVEDGARRELALVDVAVTASSGLGARAVWNADELRELFVTFAEPGAIGLSSIAGLVRPVGRDDPFGLRLGLRPSAARRVLAPIAPGLVREVGVDTIDVLRPGEPWLVNGDAVVALDGEREIELRERTAQVTLTLDGPWSLDVGRAMRLAASRGLLSRP